MSYKTGLEYGKILNKRNKIDVVPNTIKIHSNAVTPFVSRSAREWKLFASRALIGWNLKTCQTEISRLDQQTKSRHSLKFLPSMLKTIMAHLRRALALGIILLLVSHFSKSSPSPNEQIVNKVSTQKRAGEDENTVKENEPVAGKLNLSVQKCHLTFV